MNVLQFASCASAVTDEFCQKMAEYLSGQAGVPIVCLWEYDWQEREQLLDQGQAQLGWICGVWYTQKWTAGLPLELLAAPVMCGTRYNNQPVYFSDVVVRADSPFQQFNDLRGARWAYNEPHSFSGQYVVLAHLAELGETAEFFATITESGAHLNSLQMILTGQVDGAAIDSTVLEMEYHRHPALAEQLRTIHVLGPNPIPPWVISSHVSPTIRTALHHTLLTMHQHEAGRELLQMGLLERFSAVSDANYDPIRAKYQKAIALHVPDQVIK